MIALIVSNLLFGLAAFWFLCLLCKFVLPGLVGVRAQDMLWLVVLLAALAVRVVPLIDARLGAGKVATTAAATERGAEVSR